MELNADVNQVAQNGMTPLVIAADCGHLDTVRCLTIAFDADVNQAVLDDGITPLMVAALNDNEAVIKSLIHRGADVRATSTEGTAADYWREGGASALSRSHIWRYERTAATSPAMDQAESDVHAARRRVFVAKHASEPTGRCTSLTA
jgi:ankyrin repeat protein